MRWTFGSGPRVAWWFHRLLALVFLAAWLSLAAQVQVLYGARGLQPIAGVPAWQLVGGAWLGVALALAALAGRWPRVLFAVSTALYLGYLQADYTFLTFQWDNLLIECGGFAVLLPADRPAPWAHLLFRLILFKLYFESGIAKWGSSLHDWQDGSAMTWYYETAPLPTAAAWWAHSLPVGWHHFEAWATLVLELIVPFAIFGPRAARRTAAVLLTGFQIVNALTANYGFFCYLATVLHVFLLDDTDLGGAPVAASPFLGARRAWWTARAAVLVIFSVVSLIEGAYHFSDAAWTVRVAAVVAPIRPLRLINTYHLFASITRARIEPEFQTWDGVQWSAHGLHHKPGAVERRPDWVAPHQPRVDFKLWFYGLAYRQTPRYVARLLEALCRDPDAVAALFAMPLPPHPQAVRIVYWQYHFTTPAERRATGAWWTRTLRNETKPLPCSDARP